MTVPNENRVDVFPGDGVNLTLTLSYSLQLDTDVEVRQRELGSAVDGTLLTLGSDYLVGNLLGEFAEIILTNTVAVDTETVAAREVPYTQTTTVKNQGGFFPKVLEKADDRIVMQVQQIADGLAEVTSSNGRFFQATKESDTVASWEIGTQSDRINTSLGFGAAGEPRLVAVDTTYELDAFERATPTTVLNDTVFGYSTGTIVLPGDIITTRDKHIAYEVAAESTPIVDGYPLETVGLVKLFPLTDASGRLNRSAFVKEGASSADQTTALKVWLTACVGGKGMADGGTCDITETVTIGDTAAISSLDITGDTLFTRAAGNLDTNLIEITSPDAVVLASSNTGAILRYDTTIDVTDASEFTVGLWLIIDDSVDIGGGHHHGEYNRVTARDTGANTITLERPMAADHGIGDLSFSERDLSQNIRLTGNLTLQVSTDITANMRGLAIVAKHVYIETLRILGNGASRGLSIVGEDVHVVDPYVEDCNSTFAAPLTSYGISVAGNDIKVSKGFLTNCRHPISKTERTRWSRGIVYDAVNVLGTVGSSGEYDTLDFHAMTEGEMNDCVIEEGGIQLRSDRSSANRNKIKRKAGAGLVCGSDWPETVPYAVRLIGNDIDVETPDALTTGVDGAITMIRQWTGCTIALNRIRSGGAGISSVTATNNKTKNLLQMNDIETAGPCIDFDRGFDTAIEGGQLTTTGTNVVRITGGASTNAGDISFKGVKFDGPTSGITLGTAGFENIKILAGCEFSDNLTTPLNLNGNRGNFPGLTVQGNVGIANDVYLAAGSRKAFEHCAKLDVVLATPTKMFDISKVATTSSSRITTLGGAITFSVLALSGTSNSQMVVRVPILLTCQSTAVIILTQGAHEILSISTSAGVLDLTDVTVALGSATTLTAELTASVTATGSGLAGITVLSITAELEGMNVWTGDDRMFEFTPAA